MPSLLLESLFPLVFIMLLGWLSGKLGYSRREDASVLATVVIRFALPFHLFIGALNTHPDKIKNFTFMAVLVIGLMGSYFLTLLISRYVFRHDIKTSAIQSLVCAFPDMAYFGAPVLAVLIGPEGFLGVLIGNLVTSVLMIPLTIILIRMGDKRAYADLQQPDALQLILQNLFKAVRNPIVWIPISGVLLSLAGYSCRICSVCLLRWWEKWRAASPCSPLGCSFTVSVLRSIFKPVPISVLKT
ncbi:hypothetical protein SB6424_02451 [Klebsiella pasteurii]|nr:hypothetical protein SB6424_02451 [Klebsiella pasteurii]